VPDDRDRRTPDEPDPPLPIDSFAGARPVRALDAWHRLWSDDRAFPIRSHRGGLVGRLVVALKRLVRPLVKTPQADLWDRQRIFNLILLERILDERHEERLGYLEHFVPRALDDVLRHDDSLFARLDQKLDRQRHEARQLLDALGSALAVAETASGEGRYRTAEAAPATQALVRMRDERAYLELERRFRGTEEEIRQRVHHYLPRLTGAGKRGPVLDLGCGRGEALAALVEAGLEARGVDASASMVARCHERGLDATRGDLFKLLAATPEGSLGAVVSFHVIEHLPAATLERLVRLAFRALAPGGVLILETPNPLSVLVAARSFWLDPTHQRPVHPDSLELLVRLAGFEPVERLDLRPFADAERLPEVDLADLPAEQARLADAVNRLRDRLDEVLFGFQDYAVVADKPE